MGSRRCLLTMLLLGASLLATPVFKASANGQRGEWSTNGTYQYYVSANGISKSYVDSRTYCNDRGGEVAVVKDRFTQKFIQSLVTAGSGGPYAFYISLRDDAGNGHFAWEDGDQSDYRKWNNGEPNNIGKEKCVILGNAYTYEPEMKWNNIECEIGRSGQKGFVCQRKTGTYWGDWSNCTNATNGSSFGRRNRTCISTGRPGPEECDASATDVEEFRMLQPCPSTASTTSTKASISTAIEVSSVGNTTSEIRSKSLQTSPTQHTSKRQTTDAPNTLSPLVIPVAGGVGGLLVLIIIILLIVICRRRPRQKIDNDSVEMETGAIHQQHQETAEPTDEVGYASVGQAVKDTDPIPRVSVLNGTVNDSYSTLHRENAIPQPNEMYSTVQGNKHSLPDMRTTSQQSRPREASDNEYSSLVRDPSVVLPDDAYTFEQGSLPAANAVSKDASISYKTLNNHQAAQGNKEIYTAISKVEISSPAHIGEGSYTGEYSSLNRDPSVVLSNETYSSLQGNNPDSQPQKPGPSFTHPKNEEISGISYDANPYSGLNRDPSVILPDETYSTLQGSNSETQPQKPPPSFSHPTHEEIADNSYDTLGAHEKQVLASDNLYSVAGSPAQSQDKNAPFFDAKTTPVRVLSGERGEAYTLVQKKD